MRFAGYRRSTAIHLASCIIPSLPDDRLADVLDKDRDKEILKADYRECFTGKKFES